MKLNNIEQREEFTLWRRRNRVRLVDIAKYCKCTIPLISMWENGKANISEEIFKKYNEYVELFNTGKIRVTNN